MGKILFKSFNVG